MEFNIDDFLAKRKQCKPRKPYREMMADELFKEYQKVIDDLYKMGYAQALAVVLYLIDGEYEYSTSELKKFIFASIKEDKTITDYVYNFRKDFDLNL
jgi:hypothetical protein